MRHECCNFDLECALRKVTLDNFHFFVPSRLVLNYQQVIRLGIFASEDHRIAHVG